MNGRVYDYNVGRFMSVDPFIQGVGNSQGINPYSYVMNNPLGYTDPSGYTAVDPETERKITVTTTGSRIKRSVTVTPDSDGKGATIEGTSKAAVNAVKGALTALVDAYGQASVAQGNTGGSGVAANGGNATQVSGQNTETGNLDSARDRRAGRQKTEPDSNKIIVDYRELVDKFEKHAIDKTQEVFELSSEDIEVLTKFLRLQVEKMWEERSYFQLMHDIQVYDSFFYGELKFGGRTIDKTKIKVRAFGETYKAGEVNYIAVGMLAGRMNWNAKAMRQSVKAHNYYQYFFKDGGKHNLRQIKYGGQWAEFGRRKYINEDAKFGDD